jgi:Flp pilus assembly protein CpaB
MAPEFTSAAPAADPAALIRVARRHLLRHRRAWAAALAALAAASLLGTVAESRGTTTPIVVAARAIPAGALIADDALSIVDVPSRLVPEHAASAVGQLVGGRAAVPIARGEPLTPERLVGPHLLADPRRLLAPVRPADPAEADLVAVGSVVDVLASAGTATAEAASRATVVARAARVAAVVDQPGDTGLLGAESGAAGSRLVLLDVDPDTAEQVAAAAAGSRLSLALRSEPPASTGVQD